MRRSIISIGYTILRSCDVEDNMLMQRRDPVTFKEQLQAWANRTMPDSAPVKVLDISVPTGGRSSETYFLELSLAAGRRVASWVLRIEPRDHQIYENASVERQFRMAELLAARSALPVPRPILFEADQSWIGVPFFLMERAQGSAPPDTYHTEGVLFEATQEERQRLWRHSIGLLAQLHALNPEPFSFLAFPSKNSCDSIAQELARWESYRVWTRAPRDPVLDRARAWLDDNRPAPLPIGLAWGDARLSNILVHEGQCVGMLDWETASLGGAESDLGWWIFYDQTLCESQDIPRLAGIGDGSATIALWEQLSSRKLEAMEWHIAFAGYRFALIVERATALSGLSSGDARQANFATRALEKLIC